MYWYLLVFTGTFRSLLVHMKRNDPYSLLAYICIYTYMLYNILSNYHIAPELHSPIASTLFNHADHTIIEEIVGGRTCQIIT